MTLSEMADYVTAKVGQTDAQSVAICKTFLQRRNQMIWDFAIWSDSQALITLQSNAVDFSEIDFPSTVERVLNLRNITTQSPVLGVSIGTIFDFDSSIFLQTGFEYRFIHLPSGYAPVANDVGHITFVAEDLQAGDPSVITIYGNSASGQDISETVTVPLTGAFQSTTLNFTGKTGADLHSGGDGKGFIFPIDDATVLGVFFAIDGSGPPDFSGHGVTSMVGVVGTDSDTPDILATATGTFISDYGISNQPVITGSGKVELISLFIGPVSPCTDLNSGIGISVDAGSLGSNTTSALSYSQLYLMTSEVASSDIPFINGDSVFIGSYSGTIYPSTASTERIQRIRCYPPRTVRDSYLAHVKLNVQPFTDDDAVPQLKGIDNVLLAFAQADMLQRQRQYAKSQALMQEAQGQLQIMLDLEKNQQAFDSCVIPAQVNTDAYYDDFYGRLKAGYW